MTGLVLLNLKGETRFVDDQALRLHGLRSAGDAIGKLYTELWAPADRAAVDVAIQRCVTGQASAATASPCLAPADAARSLHCSFVSLVAATGAEALIAARCHEVTDTRPCDGLANNTANRQQKFDDHFIGSGIVWQVTPDLMGVLGADGIFENINPAWQPLLGWTVAEITSAPFFDFLHPDDLARNQHAFAEAMERGVPALRFENRYRRKSGGYCWLSWVAVPSGNKIYCMAHDLSAEKERERQLAERMRARDTAWARSLDLLAVAALESGLFTAVNPSWTRLLGWSESELVGHGFAEFTHPDDLPATLRVFASLAKAPLVIPYEYRLRHKNGSWRWFAWTGAVESGAVYANGRETTAARARDEALLQAESSLHQSQKMEAVGQLTGGIAHDFNNLLAAISGSLERMRKRIADGSFDDLERYLNMAQGASKRAAALTHRLLAFSRQQMLAPQVVDLNQLVSGMEDLLRRSIGPEIQLTVSAAAELWPVLADPGQTENALLNLCLNARDAMPDGGHITITTANEPIDAATAQGWGVSAGSFVSLCVGDSGSGMSAEVLARAFDPFFTTKPVGMGTGLGLSMVYGFARQSHGHVRIESEPGNGTRVWICLPRGEAAVIDLETRTRLPKPVAALGGGKRILIVDDEATIRTLVAEVLHEQGYEVAQAANADEALALIALPGELDLLISDIGLTGRLNGRHLADEARTVRTDLKVLFITGYGDSTVRDHGPLNPGVHLITKPFELTILLQRVQELLAAVPS